MSVHYAQQRQSASTRRVSKRRSTAKLVRSAVESLESRVLLSGSLIVTAYHDLVFDPTRNQLLITTPSGLLQRFDEATQTMLAPYSVGSNLEGADITPD